MVKSSRQSQTCVHQCYCHQRCCHKMYQIAFWYCHKSCCHKMNQITFWWITGDLIVAVPALWRSSRTLSPKSWGEAGALFVACQNIFYTFVKFSFDQIGWSDIRQHLWRTFNTFVLPFLAKPTYLTWFELFWIGSNWFGFVWIGFDRFWRRVHLTWAILSAGVVTGGGEEYWQQWGEQQNLWKNNVLTMHWL